MQETVGIQEACVLLGVGVTTFRKYRDRGKVRVIPPVKAQVPLEDIERILKERKEASKNESKESTSIQRGN